MLLYYINCNNVITLYYYKTNAYIITYTYYVAELFIKSALLILAHMQLIFNI